VPERFGHWHSIHDGSRPRRPTGLGRGSRPRSGPPRPRRDRSTGTVLERRPQTFVDVGAPVGSAVAAIREVDSAPGWIPHHAQARSRRCSTSSSSSRPVRRHVPPKGGAAVPSMATRCARGSRSAGLRRRTVALVRMAVCGNGASRSGFVSAAKRGQCRSRRTAPGRGDGRVGVEDARRSWIVATVGDLGIGPGAGRVARSRGRGWRCCPVLGGRQWFRGLGRGRSCSHRIRRGAARSVRVGRGRACRRGGR
jgi:hypothetical protein